MAGDWFLVVLVLFQIALLLAMYVRAIQHNTRRLQAGLSSGTCVRTSSGPHVVCAKCRHAILTRTS